MSGLKIKRKKTKSLSSRAEVLLYTQHSSASFHVGNKHTQGRNLNLLAKSVKVHFFIVKYVVFLLLIDQKKDFTLK